MDMNQPSSSHGSASGRLALAQGVFYLASGIWPIVSPRSFQLVTGPKVDMWLVKTVGALIAGIGGVLCSAGARGRAPREVRLLGALSAAALGGSSLNYALKGRISKVYLLDAVVEFSLVAGWLAVRRR